MALTPPRNQLRFFRPALQQSFPVYTVLLQVNFEVYVGRQVFTSKIVVAMACGIETAGGAVNILLYIYILFLLKISGT